MSKSVLGNGAFLTLGIVGLVAAAGAASKAGLYGLQRAGMGSRSLRDDLCARCGGDVEDHPSPLQNGDGEYFCSDECLAEHTESILARENPEKESMECPACGGEAYPMGRLGKMLHYRCRDCGMGSTG